MVGMLMATFSEIAEYWADRPFDRMPDTVQNRIEGAIHSMLCVLDGVRPGFPYFRVIPDPHPSSRTEAEAENLNWWPGYLELDVMRHEAWRRYRRQQDGRE